MAKRKRTEDDLRMIRDRLQKEIMRHVSPAQKIGMGELYEKAFLESWSNRINDTRELRKLITELRNEGLPIRSSRSHTNGGYWLATASELDAYCRDIIGEAKKKLRMAARLRNIAMPVLVGQLALELDDEHISN